MVDPEPLYQRHNEVVYGAAHHSFSLLYRQHGPAAIGKLLDQLRAGDTFDRAFQAVLGISVEAFALEFRHYLLWRGFRGGRSLR